MKKITLAAIGTLVLVLTLAAGPKPGRRLFNNDWYFYRGESSFRTMPSDTNWRKIQLPHDWSIEGPFSKDHPASPGGGALPGGIGWYRKSFVLSAEEKNARHFLEFDGIYCNSEVWINGHFLGKRPNGYISFQYDVTPYLHPNGQPNVLAVRVDNSMQPNSRWYSGSGIYRNVWFRSAGEVHIPYNSAYVTTPVVKKESAQLQVEIPLSKNNTAVVRGTATIRVTDPNGKSLSPVKINYRFTGTDTILRAKLTIAAPRLWSVEQPHLYRVSMVIGSGEEVLDEYTVQTGIRSFLFDAYKGFFLNGTSKKINGVCNHHDLGSLGAAVNKRALQRQLEILKKMGCNGIRMSHNPPAPELLDLCDEMGFIVMNESFDIWAKKKNPFDYHLDWKEWHRRDMEDFIKRDRNHASVFVWSIGNEIQEQWGTGADTTGRNIARELAAIVRSLDTTRPITSATNDVNLYNNIIQSGAMDLIGYNYNHTQFSTFHERFPGKKFIATETVSALMTRGHYDLPADSIRIWPTAWDKPLLTGNPGHTCSAYDNCHAPWGSTHEETWKEIKKHDFLSGQYIWTGFDYLGEPTPYWWPSRSSYFGIVDLAGFPKDVYYMYQSEWSNDTVLHLFPHWNWRSGQMVDVWAYYNQADEVELLLNGKSLGVRQKKNDDLHVAWKVPFEAGTLKAISRKNGKTIKEKTLSTAGAGYQLRATADKTEISGNGNDLSFITVEVLDEQGNLVPDAENFIRFSITGDAVIAGVDNGNPVSHEGFQADYRRAFHGKCLVILKSGASTGNVRLKTASDGLIPAYVDLKLLPSGL